VRIEPKLSFEHVRQLPDDGKGYAMAEGELLATPAPKPRHQVIVARLLALLLEAAEKTGGVALTAPTDVVLSPYDVVQPDLLFVSVERLSILGEESVQGAPDLVVEVLPETTRHWDLGVKLRLYARYGVRWYWAVDPENRCVHVFERAGDALDTRATLSEEDDLTIARFPGVSRKVAELFR